MIQRIQSVYLFLAAIMSGAVIFFLPLFVMPHSNMYVMSDPTFLIMFILSALISFFSIFRYRNRRQQVVSGRINIIINFVLFGLLLYTYFEAFSEEGRLGFGSFVPLVVVILISLANRNIMKDEALVRAADRLR